MHYKNGREAKVGDKIVGADSSGNPVAGVLVSASGNSTTCNGQVMPFSSPTWKRIFYKPTVWYQKLLHFLGIAWHNRYFGECTSDFNCCVEIGRKCWLRFPKYLTARKLNEGAEGNYLKKRTPGVNALAEAYDEGYEAAWDGKSIKECPYSRFCVKGKAWRRGYIAAKCLTASPPTST